MQVKTKQKTWVRRRHNIIVALAALVVYPWTKLKYHIKIEKCKDLQKRQCLIIMNHQTAFDQFFVSFAMFPRHAYFIASDDLFSLGFLSRLLSWAVAPIPIKKQATDVQAVMNCIRVAREGGSIALAPEGNRTFSGLPCYSNPAITPLIKKLGLPLAIFRIEGGYGIQPRWSDVCRKGKMRGYVSRIIEPEAYKDLSKEELFELIQKELFVDEAKNDRLYHHKRLAEYLERAMYVCPECGLSTFRSEKDIISCTKCGRQVRYRPDQRLEGIGREFPFPYVAQWYQYQQEFVLGLDPEEMLTKPAYQETAMLSSVVANKKKTLLKAACKFSLYGNRLQADDMTFFFDDVSVMTVLGKNKLNIYHKDGLYQVKGDSRFNALKYMNFYYRYKNRGSDDTFLGI